MSKTFYYIAMGASVLGAHLVLSLSFSRCVGEPLKNFLFEPVLFGSYGISLEMILALGLMLVFGIIALASVWSRVPRKSILFIAIFFLGGMLLTVVINPLATYPVDC